MTSVSRADDTDEAPEGTGTGVRASEGAASTAPAAGAKAPTASRSARTSTKSSTAKAPKQTASKPAASKSAAAKAATSAARSEAAKRAAATRAANRAAAAAAAAETEQSDASGDGAGAAKPASKRSSTSRAASAKAQAARDGAAKSSARSTASKSSASTSAARSRAAGESTAKRQAQRTAAAVATETTAAERPRKPVEEQPTVEAAAAAKPSIADLLGASPDDTPAAAAVAEAPAGDTPVVGGPEPTPADEPAPVAETPVAVASAAGLASIADEPAAEETQERVPGAESATDTPAAAQTDVAESAAAAEASVTAPAPSPTDRESDVAVAVIAAPAKKAARKKRTLRVARPAPPATAERVLVVDSLVKRFGENTAVDHISLEVRAGSFFGVVGPNGAGKTTTLSMVTGLLRPDEGTVRIHGIDAWADPEAAKRATGVLPDRLRLFDRLTGAQLLHYSGVLRGLDGRTVRERSGELIAAFGLDDAVDRLVADYSAGMTKKIALACAMIHAPRLLVLDEPFESVDPVSAANLTEILERYVAGGGTVVLSSHGMDLIERVCDSVAIVVGGRVLAEGSLDEVRRGETLEDRFVELAGGRKAAEGMEWLHSFAD
ncbi:ABC transporter ATP-binding protein [Agromyces soli]